MEALIALALKTGLLLIAFGVVAGVIALARRLLPQQHQAQRKLAAFVERGRVVELGQLLLAVVFIVAGTVITYVYS